MKKTIKRVCTLAFLFIAFICNANSQTITLTGDPIDGGENLRDEDVDMEDLRRDLSITDVILPVLTFDSGRDEISIISTAVTFENVEYEICNEVGTTYISGILYLIKGEEEFISTELLPSGTYTICINIDNCSYYGTFTK